ncbi:hypothetical protein GQ44DRAFT_71268 [Phaeosphaeriaceae sp. PMI808]|nr:hypothetical protein GQ44DRAFT_71268 [Phaeosphaeriaceae sp. PMI808]
MDSPKTPEQDDILLIPDTEERAHYFWHFDHRGPDETMADVSAAHGIDEATGRRWRQDRAQFGDARRVRKRKAAEKGHKHGRPWRVSEEQLQGLLNDKENPVRDAPIPIQQRENNIPLCPRALRYNLSNREDAYVYVAAYSDKVSNANKGHRVSYGATYKDEPLRGF